MTKFCWVHLSDLHYKKEYDAYIKSLMPSLISAINNRADVAGDAFLSSSIPYLFITGDLSFTASTEEYNKVEEIIINPLISEIGIGINDIFICPGNHDLLRKSCQSKIIQPFLDQDHKNVTSILDASNSQYKLLIKAFSNYKKFHNKLFPDRELYDPGLFTVVNLDDRPFSIISINTAWAGYGGDEDKGHLYVGLPQLTSALDKATRNNTIMILAHHPLTTTETGWFAESLDSDYSLRMVQSRCSFIFSGHVHRGEPLGLVNSRNSVGISQGGAFWLDDDNHPFRPLSFSTGWIDDENFNFRSYSFFYQPPEDKWVPVGDTSVQTYRPPAKSMPVPSPVATETADDTIAFPEVRRNDYVKLYKKVDSFKNNINVVWVQGLPGFGKTVFSFMLSDIFFGGEKPIYIKRGDENNLKLISSLIRLRYPTQWFEFWKSYVKDTNTELSDDELLSLFADLMQSAPIWFLIESGEQYNESDKPNLVKLINLVSSLNCGLRIVITTREIPDPISQPPNVLYKLEEFSKEDSQNLALSQLTCSIDFIDKIHDRFHGHPLSICAFLSQISKTELDESSEAILLEGLSKIPIDTSNLLESLWANLSNTGKKIIAAISEITELGTPLVTSICENNELEKSGLLSIYPSTSPNEERFYVHPLISEVCIPAMDSTEVLDGKVEALQVSYSEGGLALGPDFATLLLAKGDVENCSKLIESDGRAWIEISGIDKSLSLLSKQLTVDSNNIVSLYLKGLCYLFSGDYTNSTKLFRHLHSISTGSMAFNLAIKAELMECERRKGNIFGAFHELTELYPNWKSQQQLENDKDLHYIGVCGFLIGHLLRSLGAYGPAVDAYITAEKCFSSSDILSNLVERMHCQYARGLSQATSNIIDDINLIDSFSTKPFKSDFLLGLASYLHAASLIKANRFKDSLSTLSNARYHFQNFCSVAYDCRMIALSGIAELFNGNSDEANNHFSEVLKLSHYTSPQYLISSSLSECIKGSTKFDQTKILESLALLLNQGKLATAATMISCCYKLLGPSAELFSQDIDTTVYLLNIEDDQLKTESFILGSLKDVEEMLLIRLNAASVEHFYPIIE
ncbi:MAG: metallophosphoesterase [Marinilabiliaceae bacterium]|nr:metallophosphoesterase [Marinilabiliaceae bacterium]